MEEFSNFVAFSEYPNFKLAIAGMCVIAGVLPEKSTDPAAKKNVTIHTKENVRLKKKIRVKSSACLTLLTCSKKINPFLSEFIKFLFLWQKQVVGFGLVTLHHCCKQIFLCLGWKNGGFFEYEVYLLFTAGEVGGLTGVVFSIYKSTLILNIKLINNFCLHTHLFHKIRGKGLLELHFVSIMHLLTASYLDTIAEVFYYVNYVNVNYSVKNSTVDCKYLLYFLWVSRWPGILAYFVLFWF